MACQHGYAWDRITTPLIKMREKGGTSNQVSIPNTLLGCIPDARMFAQSI